MIKKFKNIYIYKLRVSPTFFFIDTKRYKKKNYVGEFVAKQQI